MNDFPRRRPPRSRSQRWSGRRAHVARTSGGEGVLARVPPASGDVAAIEALDRCDAYVVLVADPVTGAVDTYGPLPGPEAVVEADRRRLELDSGGLGDVMVQVVRHHRS